MAARATGSRSDTWPPELSLQKLPLTTYDDGEEEINELTYSLTYLLTYVRQLFVTCYVHTINSTTLCVMQWMQLFLPCNEMPASGPRPLHCSELAYRSCLYGGD